MFDRRFIATVALAMAACGGAETVEAPAPMPAPESTTFPSEPPAPLPVEDVDFPDYGERTLRNGATLVVVENHEQPVVTVQLVMPGGSAADPAELPGLASVTASQIDKGTETRTATEIAEAVDFLGANLGAGASSEWTSVSLTTITDFLDEGLALMSDVVLNPTFPEDELDTEKQRRISALRLEKSQPQSLAQDAFAENVYGDHPYGRSPSPESIEAIDATGLKGFHDRYYRPGGALFVVAGDVDPDRIARDLELAFAGWEGEAVAEGDRSEPPTRTDRRMVFVHKPGSVQAVIRLGHLFPSATGADWVTLDVANQILGSGSAQFNAWMMEILREEKGYTYGAYSSMSERQGPGSFVMSGEFRNEVADSALTIMLDLAERLRTGDIPADDLEDAKRYLTGSFPLSIEIPQQVAGMVASNRLLGRPDSYLEEYRSRVAEVTVEDVARIADELIHPDRSLIVVVGDATAVLDKVRPFADEVEVVDPEGEPVNVEALAAAAEAPGATFDASSLDPRTFVYGLVVDGTEMATQTLRWERDGDAFVTVSELPGGMTRRTTFLAETFEPVSLLFQAGGMGEFSLDVAEGRVTGRMISPQGPVDVDTELQEGTLLEGMQDVALALADYDDPGELTLKLVSGEGSIQPVGVTVAGEETVDVPAGSYETYRLEMGGSQPSTVWVTRAEPHLVVKREISGPGGRTIDVVLKEMSG
jgi:zinc protease